MLLNIFLYALSVYFVTQLAQGQSRPPSCSCDLSDSVISDFATGVNLVYYKCNKDTPATISYPIAAPQGLLKVLEKKRTIFYVFGFTEIPEDDDIQLMMRALCYGRTDNVVLLDWSKYSQGLYPIVFQNAQNVARLFARSLRLLRDNGLDTSTIYLIGLSLGAHIVGFPGKCNDFEIPRITGLDPANEFFYPPGCYLTPNDATWIDIIHTDMGKWGTYNSLGTAEYYGNGGFRPQPGCPLLEIPFSKDGFCSHKKAVTAYAESKFGNFNLTAVQCDSYASYISHLCDNNLQTGVGYAASNIRGDLPDSVISDFATGVNLVYYKCNNETPATISYPIAAPQGLLKVLEKKRTIFYVFGFTELPEDDDVQLMMRALCYKRTDNVVLLDWSKYSQGLYSEVFPNAEKVGRLFARSLRLLRDNGLDTSTIYPIGFSIGAHIVSFPGKCNDFKIHRITGLDPANDKFYPSKCYLTPNDATWIDIIHTDMGNYGTPKSLGTAEYYVNGGSRPQPGCPSVEIPLSKDMFCSHKKANVIYAESKFNNLTAVKCDSDASYVRHLCDNNLHTGVGYTASNIRGSFYFSYKFSS